LSCLRTLISYLHIPPPPLPYRARTLDTTAPALLWPLDCAPIFFTSTCRRPHLNRAEGRTLFTSIPGFSHPQPRCPKSTLGLIVGRALATPSLCARLRLRLICRQSIPVLHSKQHRCGAYLRGLDIFTVHSRLLDINSTNRLLLEVNQLLFRC
jgi:hypothetical protein